MWLLASCSDASKYVLFMFKMLVKFSFSEKVTKIWKISHLFWRYWVKTLFCQNRWEIFSNFVAFLENMNFNDEEIDPCCKPDQFDWLQSSHQFHFWVLLLGSSQGKWPFSLKKGSLTLSQRDEFFCEITFLFTMSLCFHEVFKKHIELVCTKIQDLKNKMKLRKFFHPIIPSATAEWSVISMLTA